MNAPTTNPTITVGAFSIDILVQGFPGKTVCHGGLGWSTVALVRGQGRVILIDSGNFGMRRFISERLSAHGLSPSDVTDLVLHFGGSLSGEHGDGLVRSEWNKKMFGPVVYEAFRQIKRAFDPRHLLNPGKVVDAPAMTESWLSCARVSNKPRAARDRSSS